MKSGPSQYEPANAQPLQPVSGREELTMQSSDGNFAAHEVEALVNRLCDGVITVAERDRLEQLLAASPDARQTYINYLTVNSALNWRYRTGSLQGSAGHAPGRDAPVEDAEAAASWARAKLSKLVGWPATLALAVSLLMALLMWPRTPSDQQTLEATASATESRDVFVATLREATDAVWNNTSQAVNVGSRIRTGSLRLDKGEAEIVFDSGARLLLAGPAELRLESPLAVQVQHGMVTAHMPPTAVGFELRTPTSRLVDQGTEFGVVVEGNGSTQVHVFRGQVDLHYQAAAGKQKRPARIALFDRQARQIDSLGGAGEEIEFSLAKFGSMARRVAEPIEWKVAAGGNGHFYQLVVEKEPVTWHEAARLAMNRHHLGMPGHLVAITSSEEDRFLVEKVLGEVATRGVWIGLTDVLREGHFRWVTGEPYDYTNWASFPKQQPDNFREADWHGGEDYGMFSRYLADQPWTWNDLSIDSMHEKVSAYLVEYEPPVDALRHRSMVLDPIHWPQEAGGNGHYYRVVLVLEPQEWTAIRRLAEQSEVLGVQGHLVAMESAEERSFVASQILTVCGIPELMIGLSGSLEQNDLQWVTGEPVTGFEVERSHLPTDQVYGVFRWNPAGKWQMGWEISAMSTDVLPAGWFGYLVEYPVEPDSTEL